MDIKKDNRKSIKKSNNAIINTSLIVNYLDSNFIIDNRKCTAKLRLIIFKKSIKLLQEFLK